MVSIYVTLAVAVRGKDRPFLEPVTVPVGPALYA
jgi:hypothetical protein